MTNQSSLNLKRSAFLRTMLNGKNYQADIPIEKLKAFLLQGMSQQVLFMEFENNINISEHSHEAQWIVVLDGEIELTIEGKILLLKKGDTYFIPSGA